MSQISIKTDWSELDLFGHINNVSYFKYIQAARIHFCDLAGLATTVNNRNLSFIVASTSCSFKKPLVHNEDIAINSRCTAVNTTSFEITHTITNKNNEVAATGVDILVVFDYTKNTKINISEGLKTKLLSL